MGRLHYIVALVLLCTMAVQVVQVDFLLRMKVEQAITSSGTSNEDFHVVTTSASTELYPAQTAQIQTVNEYPNSFTIIILTMNKFDLLNQLIKSLQATDYYGDNVNLIVRFDRPHITTSEWLAQVDNFKESLHWSAGNTSVTVATQNTGLRQAWLKAWQPTSAIDQAIIFEDDISVSPVWYKLLRGAERHYRNRTDMAGISLQRQTLVPLKSDILKSMISDNASSHPFLYKLVGSTGFAPKASVWQEFLEFANCANETKLALETSAELVATSDWDQQFDPPTTWTQLFMHYSKYMDLYTLYLFPAQQEHALATRWKSENGEHFQGMAAGKEFELMESLDVVYPADLLKLDWDAKPVTPKPFFRSVIMSGAVGYDAATFERFCKSLRRHYHGDIILWVSNNTTPDIQYLLNLYNVKTVPTSETGGKGKDWSKINRMRWQFYESICQADKYDLCMAVDFRDTLFQDDPFRDMQHQEGAVAYVHEHNLMMNNWHLTKAKRCRKDTDAMKNKMIINAGGFVGTPAVFPQISTALNGPGHCDDDQVMLNWLICSDKINATVHRRKQGHGNINNVAAGGVFRRDSRQQFLNHNCFPAPVVHQFDKLKKK